ncbi:MAG: N-acetylmuramoyl-L-alanine amidase [Acutalibacteraceae bacterium]|nr:N-acetylmuramoyl-L-alanine amidase [Acutalibacteraceae bacterium]
MSVISDLTKIAKSEIGNNGSKYRKWFYNRTEDYYGVNWCAVFISWLFNQVGGIDKYVVKTDGAGTVARYSDGKYGKWYEPNQITPREGDIVMFRWGGTYTDKYHSDHLGYVYSADGTYIYTIEGNTGSNNADTSSVMYKSYSLSNSVINGYYRPNYGDQKYKVYLSPSNQDGNKYATGNTSEMEVCYKIATATGKYLGENGFEVKIAKKGQSNEASIEESNSWGADLHIPIHTNAGGGKGCLAILYSYDSENVALAKPILNVVKDVIPSKTSKGYFTYADIMGNTSAQLKELSETVAIACYLECEFHDNKEYAQWLTDNTDTLGKAICRGILDYYGKDIQTENNESEENDMNFSKGESSDGVLAYKSLLIIANALGLITSKVDNSNGFGDGTYKATVEVQKKYKLEVDGIAGVKTITALRNAVNKELSDVKKAVINSTIDYLKKEINR